MAEPPAKRQRRNFQETIFVSVGEGDDKEDFTVYRSFAIKSPKFLQAALKDDSCWKEAQEKRIPLPEAKPVDFEVYLEWLYTGQLTPKGVETRLEHGTTLVRLYIMGDFLDDTKFCNKVMDAFRFDDAWRPAGMLSGPINLAWEKTMAESPLRKLILEGLVYVIANKDSYLKELLENVQSKEIACDLLLHTKSEHSLSKLLGPTATPTRSKDRCYFHRHDEENPKCSESD